MSCCDENDNIKTKIIELNYQIANLILERQQFYNKYEKIRDNYKYYIYSSYSDFYMIQELQKKYNKNELALLKPIFDTLIKYSHIYYKL